MAVSQPPGEILLDAIAHDRELLPDLLAGVAVAVMPENGRPDFGRNLSQSAAQVLEALGKDGLRFRGIRLKGGERCAQHFGRGIVERDVGRGGFAPEPVHMGEIRGSRHQWLGA